MKHVFKFLFIFLMLSGFNFFAQSKNQGIEIKKQYNYLFEGQLNAQSLNDLERQLEALPFVTLAKVKYKADSQKGEVILQTNERSITSEGDKGFDLIELKKLISSKQLIPLELNSTTIN